MPDSNDLKTTSKIIDNFTLDKVFVFYIFDSVKIAKIYYIKCFCRGKRSKVWHKTSYHSLKNKDYEETSYYNNYFCFLFL